MNPQPDLAAQYQRFKQMSLPAWTVQESLADGSTLPKINQALTEYWQLYGFDRLQAAHSPQYFFGRHEHKDQRLVLHYWRPASPAGTVLVVHGLFDHVGIYLKLIDFLLANNYAVIAFDLPGHGLSSGEPAAIDDFTLYAESLGVCLNAMQAKWVGPLYALGQSTGGAALAAYLLDDAFCSEQRASVQKVVLLAPLIYPVHWLWVRMSYLLASRFIKRVTRSFNVSSHDSEFNNFLEHADPLQARYVSVAWVGAMIKWVDCFAELSECTLPTLIVQGSNDKTVDAKRNIPLYQKKFTSSRLLNIDGAAHHLVNESLQYRVLVCDPIKNFFIH